MEKALNEMREDIGMKDEYQNQLVTIKAKWEEFEPHSEGMDKLYEKLNMYQNDSQTSTEQIISLTNLLKAKIKKYNKRIEQGKYFLQK